MFLLLYSGLNLNQYGVASPCPDLNLIHYRIRDGKRSPEHFQTTFSFISI
ncbi:hypothetical protein MCC93_18820 [Morococcus cerebrosus]|uniref:Uncharacterized protein n=1 Tax=Morococcus cerebrosus TaxID=1056807 RepID=A0A0C1GMS7_9NEIS|nr:hypothetical protein MCC93_18820 [Morococcus cerebrosus]